MWECDETNVDRWTPAPVCMNVTYEQCLVRFFSWTDTWTVMWPVRKELAVACVFLSLWKVWSVFWVSAGEAGQDGGSGTDKRQTPCGLETLSPPEPKRRASVADTSLCPSHSSSLFFALVTPPPPPSPLFAVCLCRWYLMTLILFMRRKTRPSPWWTDIQLTLPWTNCCNEFKNTV